MPSPNHQSNYNLPRIQGSDFQLPEYLDGRGRDDFVMVEIGPSGASVAPLQEPFVGGRCYIGVEAYLRDPTGIARVKLKHIIDNRGDGNIFLLNHDPGGRIARRNLADYKGRYDTRTILPDNTASEVFLSNVFCDPMVGNHRRRRNALLKESARLIKPGGMIVIRDTITPDMAAMEQARYKRLGLQPVLAVTTMDDSWQSLESRFNGRTSPDFIWRPKGYYLFLRSQVQTKESR